MRDQLLKKRNKIVNSIFWGTPWNRRKVQEIDELLTDLDNIMYVLCKLEFHGDYPYKNRIDTEKLLEILRT